MSLPRIVYRSINKIIITNSRYYSTKHPISKTWNVFKKDVPGLFGRKKDPTWFPEHADVVIIGGGFIGSSIAYWLKTRTSDGLNVVVLEKDFSYKNAQMYTAQSALTQHFSLPENILLSKCSAEFMRNIKENLDSDVDIQFLPTGSLILASDKYADKLEENITLQREYGLRNQLLTVEEINTIYPWLNTHDVKLGSIAYESEGTFNSWALLKGLLKKSKNLGANYVNAEVIGFDMEKQRDVLMEGVTPGSYERLNKVIYRTPDGDEYSLKFAMCILAAGESSADIAKLAKVGTGDALLKQPLPIAAREQKVYSIAQKGIVTGLNTPMIMDTSGLWIRRNGFENNLLFGHVPLISDEAKHLTEKEYYTHIIKPSLSNRVPICKNEEGEVFDKEIYDYNSFDDTGILGPHPYHNNLYIAAGFGKLGCQHAPAIGKVLTELIIDSTYRTVDLTRFGFDRLMTGESLVEFNVY